MMSSPSPPIRASTPSSPSILSLPPLPQMESSPSPPRMVLAASVSWMTTCSAPVKRQPSAALPVSPAAFSSAWVRIQVERKLRGREHVMRNAVRGGVAHDDLGQRVAFQRVEERVAQVAGQVVEPVAVLQVLELLLKDVVEGRAQHAAEDVRLLGHAAHPEVNVVHAGLRGRRLHERGICCQCGCRRTLGRQRVASVTEAWLAYAARKLTMDSGFFIERRKSSQLV